MLPRAIGGFNEPPSGYQGLDSGLHCGHGKLQNLTHVDERRERLVPLVGAAAKIAVDGKVPHGQRKGRGRQTAPAAAQIPQLVGVGNLLAVAAVPGAHCDQALLGQPGNGGAHRVLAHAAPILDGGAAHRGRAQAVLAGRQVHVDLQLFGLQTKIEERIIQLDKHRLLLIKTPQAGAVPAWGIVLVSGLRGQTCRGTTRLSGCDVSFFCCWPPTCFCVQPGRGPHCAAELAAYL